MFEDPAVQFTQRERWEQSLCKGERHRTVYTTVIDFVWLLSSQENRSGLQLKVIPGSTEVAERADLLIMWCFESN